jgi:hypothetical protein
VTDIWSLPGPARFAAVMRARLDRGYSLLAGLPSRTLRDATFCAGLLDAVDRAADILDDCENGSRPLASLVSDRFSIDDIRPGPDAAAALARHGTLSGRVLVIMLSDAEQGDRWASFALPFVVASRTIPVAERPLLMLLSGSVGTAALAGCDPLLSDIWWWGVLDRLDTALHVKSQLADGGDELLRDSITEVAGFDLGLAAHLATAWDGADATLSGALERFPGPALTAPSSLPPLPHSSTPLSAPPAGLLPMWDQGLIDRWDAFPAYWHACALPTADLRSRVWRAQIRALMPAIDEERARVESWLRQQVRTVGADTVLEPSDLYALLQQYPHLKTWRGGHRKRLIYWLRDTRNTLAHMGTLTPDEVAYGRQLMREDHRGG